VKLINLDKKVKVAKIAKVREKVSDGDQEFDNVDEAVDSVSENTEASEVDIEDGNV
jgi:DNA gyrase subunit A